jgi:hypothetical protein
VATISEFVPAGVPPFGKLHAPREETIRRENNIAKGLFINALLYQKK